MLKTLKVFWTENAVQDLVAIKDFISQDSLDRAKAWALELYSQGESLSQFSSRGRIVPEFGREDLRELLIDSYRLVYRIKAERVEIVTVFDGHRQLKAGNLKK
jgi:toxin ParE1/3/4